jgi:hypothetical protein
MVTITIDPTPSSFGRSPVSLPRRGDHHQGKRQKFRNHRSSSELRRDQILLARLWLYSSVADRVQPTAEHIHQRTGVFGANLRHRSAGTTVRHDNGFTPVFLRAIRWAYRLTKIPSLWHRPDPRYSLEAVPLTVSWSAGRQTPRTPPRLRTRL